MGKDDTVELKRFLQPFSEEITSIALWLREFVWDLYPHCNELIYDNYNALAFGWSPTDRLGHTFCSVAVMEKYLHFGFYWGAQIADPEKKLSGKGNQYRYIKISSRKDFPVAYIKKLLKEAYANSLAKVKDDSQIQTGQTIVKSISPARKRPGIVTAKKKKSKHT